MSTSESEGKVTVTIEAKDVAEAEKILAAARAAVKPPKPQPDSNGYCQCATPDFVHVSDWAGGSYCNKCNGKLY